MVLFHCNIPFVLKYEKKEVWKLEFFLNLVGLGRLFTPSHSQNTSNILWLYIFSRTCFACVILVSHSHRALSGSYYTASRNSVVWNCGFIKSACLSLRNEAVQGSIKGQIYFASSNTCSSWLNALGSTHMTTWKLITRSFCFLNDSPRPGASGGRLWLQDYPHCWLTVHSEVSHPFP